MDNLTWVQLVAIAAWTAYIFRLGRSYCQRDHASYSDVVRSLEPDHYWPLDNLDPDE